MVNTAEFWGLFALPADATTLKVETATFRELEVPVHRARRAGPVRRGRPR
ncbi:hypothetical protein [Nonomuraea cavernae]|nr:hypothetical protein [Nonomuraea cavernae]MCA2184534.1 hypothetical protein [Nonomuraea cavernae]